MRRWNRWRACWQVALVLLCATGLQAQSDLQQRLLNQLQTAGEGKKPVQLAGASSTEIPLGMETLKLAPGFLVALQVLDDPDFTGEFRVDARGEIVLPVLGSLPVMGKTEHEVGAEIRKQLMERRILLDPQVEVAIREYVPSEITILGEVNLPGRYPLLAERNLVDVLALAGGVTNLAGNQVEITGSGDKAQTRTLQYSRNMGAAAVRHEMIAPGDTVLVKRAGIIYVLGAVNRPGGFVMQEEGTLTILQAIALANGTSLTAAPKVVFLVRKGANGAATVQEIPFLKIAHGKGQDAKLEATDVLFVPTSKTKAMLMNSQALLAAAASASVYGMIR